MKFHEKLAMLLRNGFVLLYTDPTYLLVNPFHKFEGRNLVLLVDDAYGEEYRGAKRLG